MRFKTLYASSKEYFSVGIEECSGDYFLSIPVRNSKVEYSEYYRIPTDLYKKHESNPENLLFIAEECRQHLRDIDLFIDPGFDRGSPL